MSVLGDEALARRRRQEGRGRRLPAQDAAAAAAAAGLGCHGHRVRYGQDRSGTTGWTFGCHGDTCLSDRRPHDQQL